ncbi:MAG: hypothetical protein PHY48_13030, partial [Candidatus Cloacimonetes bacterium]|nr:hypothetical protein [Candidatus Cloacimonadota bacterium]
MSQILQQLETASVKSILLDGTWLPSQNKVGVSSLSFGNNLKIEAEYQLKTDSIGNFVVDELITANQAICMESYDYVTKHDCGANDYNEAYSNDYAWICDASQGDSAGVALSQPRKRWKPSWKPWPSMLSKDIVFLTDSYQFEKLYLKVAMRFEGVDPGDSVADISLKFYDPLVDSDYSEYDPIPEPSRYVPVPLTSCSASLYSSSISAQTYPETMKDEFNNYVFDYYIYLPVSFNLMDTSSSSTRQFFHINPEIYWHGNGKLIIDYIVIEDEHSRSVRQDPNSPYISQLNNQINCLDNVDPAENILYYYAMDEPRPAQLQMYKTMQNHLNSLNPPRKLLTATWLKDYSIVKHDGKPYNYHKRFLTETNPDRIMVDIYPLQWYVEWHGNVSSYHVQKKIDDMIHYYYHKLVTNIQQSNNPDTEIFYVPQTFGNVLAATDDWSYVMPPRSMIKTLKFLPLCYAADGMVDFCVASNPAKLLEKGHWVTPLSQDQAGDNYQDQYNNLRITDNVSAYSMITDANRKIAVYGPIIRSLNWLNANKVMDSGISLYPGLAGEDGINLSNVLLNNLHIEAEIDSTGYSGYVQCGYYNDTHNRPSFMLVNRRSVYDITAPAGTPLKYVDLFFHDAAPQTVCFEPDIESHSMFGDHIAMYDPYDDSLYYQNGQIINVEIGPGDGKLLQMISTLPDTVNTAVRIFTKGILEGDITIASGGSVSV